MDLCYEEDSTAEVDMNIVMTDKGEIVEIQGTGEERPFTRDEFQKLMALGEDGVYKLINIQKEALGTLLKRPGKGTMDENHRACNRK